MQFPVDLDSLAGGPVRVIYADGTEPLPVKPLDINDQSSPYALNGGWKDFGATAAPLQQSRNMQTTGWRIQQRKGDVFKKVSELTRQVAVPFAEFSPEILQIIEQAPEIETVATSAGQGAGKKIAFGSVFELDEFRLAFLVERLQRQGVVTEPTTAKKRGRFLYYVAYRVTLAGDNIQVSWGEDEMATGTITFELQPDPDVTDEGEEHGFWFDEDAGTFTAPA